jgi:REP element-mobilizing transposase RayT
MEYKQHKQYRLPHFNYASTGHYFITIVAKNRLSYFGETSEGKMVLSPIGALVQKCWLTIPSKTSYAKLDAFVVMPNHLHGIILLENPLEPRFDSGLEFQPQKKSLSLVVRNFKAAVTAAAHALSPGIEIWQFTSSMRKCNALKELTLYLEHGTTKMLYTTIARRARSNSGSLCTTGIS